MILYDENGNQVLTIQEETSQIEQDNHIIIKKVYKNVCANNELLYLIILIMSIAIAFQISYNNYNDKYKASTEYKYIAEMSNAMFGTQYSNLYDSENNIIGYQTENGKKYFKYSSWLKSYFVTF